MLEALGQYGPGYVKHSYHDVRVPLLEKAKNSVDEIKKTHELAWTKFGCTLMSDGWTDRRGRHLINFLVNSPAGTFFLESVNASSEITDAQMLAALLEKRIDAIGRDKVVQIVTYNGLI
jgi:proline dehydrogenase